MAESDMVSIRELSHETSRTLRRVKAGETIEITERGRVIGRIVPAGSERNRLDQLIAVGRATPSSRDHSTLLAAVDHRLANETVDESNAGTNAILAMRDEERY